MNFLRQVMHWKMKMKFKFELQNIERRLKRLNFAQYLLILNEISISQMATWKDGRLDATQVGICILLCNTIILLSFLHP